MMLRVTLPLALLLAASLGASGQSCDSLRAVQQRTYGFHPAQLSHEQQDVRGNQIDDFWTAVKQAGPDGITCLKSMLVSQKSDGYFQFDGASLLYSLDHSPAAVQAAADAVGLSDLADLDPVGYIGLA